MEKIEIIGNIGRDAEKKTIKDKQALVFNVGVSNGYGENKTTTWYEVVWFTKFESLQKGVRVFVSGRPKINVYTHKDGSPAANVTIFANEVEIVSRPNAAAPAVAQTEQAKPQTYSDEIPF